MSLDSTLEKVIDSKIAKAMGRGPQSVTAEYRGMDSQGKQWVVLAGSTEATPLNQSSVEARPGDTVSVTVGGGRAVMDANMSNPSAGVDGVKEVSKTANKASDNAEKAIAFAGQASKAASNAMDHAETARLASVAAQESADSASQAAEKAWEHADDATEAATVAQRKLSEVEDVVDTVNWIAEHGSYESQEG